MMPPLSEERKAEIAKAAKGVVTAWDNRCPVMRGDFKELQAQVEALTERVARLEKVVRPKGLFG
jgi:hypothetical protein